MMIDWNQLWHTGYYSNRAAAAFRELLVMSRMFNPMFSPTYLRFSIYPGREEKRVIRSPLGEVCLCLDLIIDRGSIPLENMYKKHLFLIEQKKKQRELTADALALWRYEYRKFIFEDREQKETKLLKELRGEPIADPFKSCSIELLYEKLSEGQGCREDIVKIRELLGEA